MIDQQNINSSNVKIAAYDDDVQTMYVEFISGYRYKYVGIPRMAYENLCIAPSAGKYLKKISQFYPGVKY